jgi:hypothetical protein
VTHRKGEKELNDRVEDTKKGRFLVIVSRKSVKTIRLPAGARRMERTA